MKLSTATEQACCILALIASRNLSPITNAELSERMAVSPSYLAKITRRLVVAELISSEPGAKGGFVLALPMRLITLLMVVEAIEGNEPFFQPAGVVERVFKNRRRAVEKGMSVVQEKMHEAELAWRRSLSSVTMQEIVDDALKGEML